jgi:hypothetical protein
VIHLRDNDATPNTPLASFVQAGRTKHVTTANVTDFIQKSVTVLGPSIYWPPHLRRQCTQPLCWWGNGAAMCRG